jgi:hypothetical protein
MRRLIVGAALLVGLAPAFLASAGGRVAPTAAEVQPIKVGALLPAVSLRTPEGATVALADLTGDGPVALVFYRGGW